jgi:hypothetical protein
VRHKCLDYPDSSRSFRDSARAAEDDFLKEFGVSGEEGGQSVSNFTSGRTFSETFRTSSGDEMSHEL